MNADQMYTAAKFAHEINEKMRVPMRIKGTGEFSNENLFKMASNQNLLIRSWNYEAKFSMNVPERLLAVGSNPCMGRHDHCTPQIITLTDRDYPTDSEDSAPNLYHDHENVTNDDGVDATPALVCGNVPEMVVGFSGNCVNLVQTDLQLTNGDSNKRSQHLLYDGTEESLIVSHYGGTLTNDVAKESMNDELRHLRDDLAKLNRRVLCIESNNEQRLQREKIAHCLGLAYFVLKGLLWLNRQLSFN